jgi:hypothetical protein
MFDEINQILIEDKHHLRSYIKYIQLSNSIFLYHFSGDIIMTGEGHKDWIAGCDFHPG